MSNDGWLGQRGNRGTVTLPLHDDHLNSACPLSPAAEITIAHTAGTSTLADVRLDIDPSFENDSDMVSAPPGQLAFADRSKVVERNKKIDRKKPEFI